MRFDAYLEALARAQETPLPATDAQLSMAPEPRRGWKPGLIPDDCRTAAVLLVVFPIEGMAHLLLTQRAAHLRHHPGQISLPGGELKEGEAVVDGACREACEEVGVDQDRIHVDGSLTPLHVPVSRYVIQPVLAHLDERPTLHPDPAEVAAVLEIPLGDLFDPATRKVELRHHEGQSFRVPYLDVGGEKLWGATAMILAEWRVWLGYCGNP